MRRNRSFGFTLVEILVVLIIVGMVAGILMQALSQIYKLQGRFGQQLAQSQVGAMYADWFRQIVQGLQTDVPLGADKFSGTETSLQGLSTSPLSSDYGVPARVTLKTVFDHGMSRLQYESGSQRTDLFAWSGKAAGKFVYLDAGGEPHDQWPPPLGQWPQLPSVVMLQLPLETELLVLAAVPRGSKEAKQPRLKPLGELK